MNELLGGAAVGLATFLITWGMMRGKVIELERRMTDAENEAKTQRTAIQGLSDVYVNYRHFNEVMSSVRESYRELKDDVKKILELLSVRA